MDLLYAFNDKLPVDISSVSKILINTQERNWLNQLPSKPKLRFYTLFKNTLNVENFVKYNLTPSERSLVSQYRMGILPLAIETGRFQGVKLEERLCIFCNSGAVEDEVHFMFDCSLYNDLREEFFNTVIVTNPNFIYESFEEQLKILFSDHHRKLAKFIKKSYLKRKATLYA